MAGVTTGSSVMGSMRPGSGLSLSTYPCASEHLALCVRLQHLCSVGPLSCQLSISRTCRLSTESLRRSGVFGD